MYSHIGFVSFLSLKQGNGTFFITFVIVITRKLRQFFFACLIDDKIMS